ncbi:MAG: protein-L-isoaspartate O-methyltransferase [Candidatus Omnitrophota bacterium]|nr:MAG: protein-L-isoaspartate O-methyltransferase [Candidatus Omnitrophota bacterium]
MEDNYQSLRKRMVEEQLIPRGIKDKSVLKAFLNIPREFFVPLGLRKFAYADRPLLIGYKQTISQPFMVALMVQLLQLKRGDKVLEIGTGSGYQAAILCYLGCEVFTIERIKELADTAEEKLEKLQFKVKIKVGDGTLGWEEFSPFDKIIVAAGAKIIPPPLLSQLREGGRLVIPVGNLYHQELIVVDKRGENEYIKNNAGGCIFVPLVGKYGYED